MGEGRGTIKLAPSPPRDLPAMVLCRPDWDEVVSELHGLGADVVTTEAKLKEDLRGCGAVGCGAAGWCSKRTSVGVGGR